MDTQLFSKDDEKFMRIALAEADKAMSKSEVPVGAVVVLDGKVIAKAHNLRSTNDDPTGHAEILVLRKAGKKLGRWNLEGCEVYVTKEPCAMCAGAMVMARIKRVYFGASDVRFGCAGTAMNICNNSILNHRTIAVSGLLEYDCAKLLLDFFHEKRAIAKQRKIELKAQSALHDSEKS